MTRDFTAESFFDWEGYVLGLGATEASSRRAEYLLDCPDCNKHKLAVNADKHVWRCFVCGDGGRDITSLIRKIQKVTWNTAKEVVRGGTFKPIGDASKLPCKLGASVTKSLFIPKERGFPHSFEWVGQQTVTGQASLAYCYSRGITPDAIHGMRLGACSMGRFINRLIFPVFDSGDRVIFYQGRAMWESDNPRHVKCISPELQDGFAGPSDCLLNLSYLVSIGAPKRVAVVEGPVDCAHAWPDAVATFGKKISDRQISLLKSAGVEEIDLCWDSDAIKDMHRYASILADYFTVRIVRFPTGKDPGDFDKPTIDAFRRNAVLWGEHYNELTSALV